MEKAYLVFVGGKIAPWVLRSKWGSLIRRRKTSGCLQDWAKQNGYDVEVTTNPVYETR